MGRGGAARPEVRSHLENRKAGSSVSFIPIQLVCNLSIKGQKQVNDQHNGRYNDGESDWDIYSYSRKHWDLIGEVVGFKCV